MHPTCVTGDVISVNQVREELVKYTSSNDDVKAIIREQLVEQSVDEYVQCMLQVNCWSDENIIYDVCFRFIL